MFSMCVHDTMHGFVTWVYILPCMDSRRGCIVYTTVHGFVTWVYVKVAWIRDVGLLNYSQHIGSLSTWIERGFKLAL